MFQNRMNQFGSDERQFWQSSYSSHWFSGWGRV